MDKMEARVRHLALINKLIAMQHPAQQIDLAIKIYDEGQGRTRPPSPGGCHLYRPPTRQLED